jgi:hypothetical protein
MATGRTSPRFAKFQIEDAGGAMRDVPVSSLGSVGLTYDEIDVSAMQELVKTFLAGQASFSMTITGPFDNTAAATASASGESAAASLSGSYTVLEPLNGGLTPLSFGVYFGVQTDWTTGDPVFGGIGSVIVTDFTMDPSAGTYSAKLAHVSGGTAPGWGTTAITASA